MKLPGGSRKHPFAPDRRKNAHPPLQKEQRMGVGSSDQPGLTAARQKTSSAASLRNARRASCVDDLLAYSILLHRVQLFAARCLKLDGLARAHDHAQLAVFHPAHRFNDLFLRLGQMKRCLMLFHGGHLPFTACRRAGTKKPRGHIDPARK